MKIKSVILCSLFTALIAIGAFIKIPMPYIPFTLQTLFVLLAGALLGAKKGAVSVAVYILIGLIGIPVFSQGGGIGYVFKPSFGYIIGFYFGAYAMGFMVERLKKTTFLNVLFAGVVGTLVIYLYGLTYFYIIMNYYLNKPIGLYTLLLNGFLLTIPADIIKCVACSLILSNKKLTNTVMYNIIR